MSETVLITGASTGIGYEFCHLFAKDKFNLIIVARNMARLLEVAKEMEEKYKVKVYTFASDLSKENSPDEIFQFTKKNSLVVDVLVNNAGFGTNGPFAQNDLNSELDLIRVNILSLVRLTHSYLPEMIIRKNGKILNVASTAGFQPGPFMTNYYASKAYVLHFTEGLAEEVREHGVTVSALCPGPTITAFAERANMKSTLLMRDGFFSPTMLAKPVAEIGYSGLNRGKVIVIAGLLNFIIVLSLRTVPRFLVRKIAKMINYSRG